MKTTSSSTTPVQAIDDPLVVAMDHLAQAIERDFSGHEQKWQEAMECAAVDIENALRRHRVTEKTKDGVLAEVDKNRPTAVNEANEVREEHSELLRDAIALRRAVRAPGAEIAAVRVQAEKLLAQLRQNRQSETHLLQESVNTDIGVAG